MIVVTLSQPRAVEAFKNWAKKRKLNIDFKVKIRDIVKLYIDKVMKESSTSEDIVVFDSYDSSAKDHCRLLRSPIRDLQNDLDWNTPVTTQQPVFLSNSDNKCALIGFLGDAF